MNTKTSLEKGRYEAPQCSEIALSTGSCLMQGSIMLISIIDLSTPITTEKFDVVDETNLW